MRVVGVDFSGAKADSNTWVAQGCLDGGHLHLTDCRPVSRSELVDLLVSLPDNAVAALDFPFSVPSGFAGFWEPQAASMPDLWDAAAAMDMSDFLELRNHYVRKHGEPKRRCDTFFPECYSCLHNVNPNMVPMTFRGMQMLSGLWARGCKVPPLAPPRRGKALLLEAMPGAALRAFHLPYKGYKNGKQAAIKRVEILEGLAQRSGVGLPNLDIFRQACLASHDCLDSVVAAVVGVLWKQDPGLFWRPELDGPDSAAILEGWLYAPVNKVVN